MVELKDGGHGLSGEVLVIRVFKDDHIYQPYVFTLTDENRKSLSALFSGSADRRHFGDML